MPYTKLNASKNSCYYDDIGRECSICHKFHSWHYYWPAGNKHAINGKCSECQSCQRKKDADRRLRYRLEALAILGGKCAWAYGCDVDDPEMLQIDHIDGNKLQENSQTAVAHIRAGETKQYQVLCANHHMKKSYNEGDFVRRYIGADVAVESSSPPPSPQMDLL